MGKTRVNRRLAAIVAADVAGFSRLTGLDEEGTLARLKSLRQTLIDPAIASAGGRIVKTTGDGILIEFTSTVDALRCSVEVQRAMRRTNAGLAPEQRMDFRLGLHVGDVVVDDADLLGDGVNIAARLEGLAEPGGISISEDAWRQVEGKLPVRFVDTGEQSLKNIARPVRVYRVDHEDAATHPAFPPAPGPTGPNLSAPGMALQGKPSIAVLPFTNMSGDPEQEVFADGLAEDIITTLSKLVGLRVIARNSSFVYKGRAVDIREVARQLGVQYVLEGSVRANGNRIRITAQLIDAVTGSHLWAERYDRAFDDIFAVQDEITLVLATEMQVKLTEGEQARLHYTTTSNVEAWTHWVQGLFDFREAVTRENTGRARAHWEKALALDPASATLNARLGFVHFIDARFGWWNDRQVSLARARDYADRALGLDSENADACITAGLLLLAEERFDEALAFARRGVRLAAGSADAASFASFILAMAGAPEEAVRECERAMTLSPHYPAFYLGHLGNAYRLSGRLDEAISAFRAYDARSPGFGLADLVIIYQTKGEADRARETAARLRAVRQDFTVASWLETQFRHDPARLAADAGALRAAGLPEG